VDGIVNQPGGVVGVRLAAGDTGEAPPAVDCLQQDGVAVGAAVGLVRVRHQGLAEQTWKQDALCCGGLEHAKASGAREDGVSNRSLPHGGLCASGRQAGS